MTNLRSSVVVVSAVVVVAATRLPFQLGLMTAALIGIGAGLAIEEWDNP
jgi:hypothetical protein